MCDYDVIKEFLDLSGKVQTTLLLNELRSGFISHPEITQSYVFDWLPDVNRYLRTCIEENQLIDDGVINMHLPSSYSRDWFRNTGCQITGDLSY